MHTRQKVSLPMVILQKDPAYILKTIRFLKKNRIEEEMHWQAWPLNDHPEKKIAYLELNKHIIKVFSDRATLLEQIEFLNLVGLTGSIERNKRLSVASTYYKFCTYLTLHQIINPTFNLSSGKLEKPIRRIHAVHQDFLRDNEIRSGLQISFQKNSSNDWVLYVCNPETLEMALGLCEPHSTLIIDGHWQHSKRSTHGVWEVASAQEIATELTHLFSKYPHKIKSIKLLGCEAGYLPPYETLAADFNKDALIFKDEMHADFNQKPMAEFRNRSIYYSSNKEFPYAKDSLAGEIILSLNDPSINITACPSHTYPYPVSDMPNYNIASDSSEWAEEPFWKPENASHPSWYSKVQRTKSITTFFMLSPTLQAKSCWPTKLIRNSTPDVNSSNLTIKIESSDHASAEVTSSSGYSPTFFSHLNHVHFVMEKQSSSRHSPITTVFDLYESDVGAGQDHQNLLNSSNL